MSPEVYSIDLTVERSSIPDVLRGIIFGNLKPKEVDLLDITYSAIDDPTIERTIEDKIQQFMKNLEIQNSQSGKVAVMFHEKRTKKGWLGKTEEEICWEQWAITINIVNYNSNTERERLIVHKEMAEQFYSCLFDIICYVNEKKDHIPPITTSEANPFPYQIFIPSTNDNWGSLLKKMLTEPPQPI
nr:10774_t:CDS:2 [Entrophospora candida]